MKYAEIKHVEFDTDGNMELASELSNWWRGYRVPLEELKLSDPEDFDEEDVKEALEDYLADATGWLVESVQFELV